MIQTSLFDLTGKVALLTGASKGMGKAMATALAEHGAQVMISSRKLDACQAVADSINAACGATRVHAFACNAGYKEQLQALVDATRTRLGPIDILVGNAGVNPYYGKQLEVPDEAYDKTMATNVKSNLWLVKMVAPDMVAKGKTANGFTWASAGNGTVGHLYTEQFKQATQTKLLHVPYKGAAPALNDVIGGSVDLAILSVPSVLPLVNGGKLKPVAVTTAKRSPMLPDTPTLDEAGVKGIDVGIWLGLFAPVGTPAAIVARLNTEINKVLALPDVREKIANGGATAVGGTSEEFGQFVRADYARWGKIAKESNIKLD